VKDHVRPLACGGPDAVANIQWQTIADAKAKDRSERRACGRYGSNGLSTLSGQHPGHARRKNVPPHGAARCRDGGARRRADVVPSTTLTPRPADMLRIRIESFIRIFRRLRIFLESSISCWRAREESNP
jgi:hypothetical protein